MPVNLPDPRAEAANEATYLNANREMFLITGVDRVLADSPWVERGPLLGGLVEFHAERMRRVPSPVKYPESPRWVEHVMAVDRELKRLANLTDEEMAIWRSLSPYLTYRGYANSARRRTATEKCRVVYLPESDRGQVHIKNVDDPLKHWKPYPTGPAKLSHSGDLVHDGVGSGLHMDDEPDELFPLQPLTMMYSYCNDVPSAVEFLTRYKSFWSGCNYMLRDRRKRSVAIEKCSANFMEVFYPGPDGQSHVSGMVCRDPNSPQGKHQSAMRQRYLTAFGQTEDGPDNTYWKFGYQFEERLAALLKNLGKPAGFDKLVQMFITPWPQGFNKCGVRVHPESGTAEYTLFTEVALLDEQVYYRWQRSEDGKYFPTEPEVYNFGVPEPSTV